MAEGDWDRYAERDAGDGGVRLILKREGTIARFAVEALANSPRRLAFPIEDEGFDVWKK